jgi:hypothetical protein
MRKFFSTTLFLFLLAVIGVSVNAQFAIPISDYVSKGDLFVQADSLGRVGRPLRVHFEAREGTMVTVRTVRNEGQDSWVGFVPVIDKGARVATLTPFTLEAGDSDYPSVNQLMPDNKELLIKARLNSQATIPYPEFPVTLELHDFGKAYFPELPPLVDPSQESPDKLVKLYGASGGGLCSLTCGTITVSATSVSMPCGTCTAIR